MRVRAWLAAAAVLACAAFPATLPRAQASFTGGSASVAAFSATTVLPPTNLTATRTCGISGPTLVTTSVARSTTGTVTVTRPSAVVAGDLVLALITGPTGGGPYSSDGWSLYGGAMHLGGVIMGKIASSAEPSSYTINGLTVGQTAQVLVLVYRGVDTGNPWTYVATDTTSTASTTITGAPYTVWSPDNATLMVGIVSVPSYTGAITPGAGWTTATTVSPSDAQPGTVLVAGRPVVANTGVAMSATVATAKTGSVLTFALHPTTTPTPTGPVALSWTPTATTAATGYEGYRSDYVGVLVSGGPRTLSGYTDTSLGSAGATYSLRSVLGSWRSDWVTVTVPACP